MNNTYIIYILIYQKISNKKGERNEKKIFKEKENALSAIETLKKKFSNVYLCTPEKYGVEIISICE